jgi:hypothetical protein
MFENGSQNRLPNGKIPDAVDITNKIVRDLKPMNPKKFKAYLSKSEVIDELEQLHGGKWKWSIDFYQNGF